MCMGLAADRGAGLLQLAYLVPAHIAANTAVDRICCDEERERETGFFQPGKCFGVDGQEGVVDRNTDRSAGQWLSCLQPGDNFRYRQNGVFGLGEFCEV